VVKLGSLRWAESRSSLQARANHTGTVESDIQSAEKRELLPLRRKSVQSPTCEFEIFAASARGTNFAHMQDFCCCNAAEEPVIYAERSETGYTNSQVTGQSCGPPEASR